jgi:hypothetical protein
MKVLQLLLLGAIAMLLPCPLCHAGASAVLIIYQPIMTGSEATVIETPKGFAIMPIPYECYYYHGKPPFYAIAQPNPILTDAPRSVSIGDSNLVSSAGITIGSSIDDDIVSVHFESLRLPAGFEITEDDIAEATLECIRRMAQDAPKRPTVRISSKPGEEAKWKRWEECFNKDELTKTFKRPDA